jgi:hypothetical protein
MLQGRENLAMLQRNSSPRPRLGGHSSCSPEARSHIETYKFQSASLRSASPGSTNSRARAGPELFPPELVVEVKALACELPAKLNLPLSRLSVADVTDYLRGSGLVASISESTIWRWLDQDAIRPGQHRCWIFPCDPASKNSLHRSGCCLMAKLPHCQLSLQPTKHTE